LNNAHNSLALKGRQKENERMDEKINNELSNKNIEKIIIDTFNDVLKMSSEEQITKPIEFDKDVSCEKGPVLMYPEYRNKTTVEEDKPSPRMSEQELKQKFIDNLKKSEIHCFYSVETPSKDSYNFKKIPRLDRGGQSALFDLSLYDKNKKIFSHLEFKCGNVVAFCITKDLLKLSTEPGLDKNYFIHIVNGFDKGTYKSLNRKYVGELPTKNEDEENLYKIIRDGLSKRIIIYLLVVRNQIKEYNGSKDKPVSGFFKLVYDNTGLNWKWHELDKDESQLSNNNSSPRIPQG
jgi:hypothetical protein